MDKNDRRRTENLKVRKIEKKGVSNEKNLVVLGDPGEDISVGLIADPNEASYLIPKVPK